MLEAALFFDWSAVAEKLAGDAGGNSLETTLLQEVQLWLLARKSHGDVDLETKEKPLDKSPLKVCATTTLGCRKLLMDPDSRPLLAYRRHANRHHASSSTIFASPFPSDSRPTP